MATRACGPSEGDRHDLPIAREPDDAGFWRFEFCRLAYQKSGPGVLEDPWERQPVAKLAPKTPLRLIAGRVNTFGFESAVHV